MTISQYFIQKNLTFGHFHSIIHLYEPRDKWTQIECLPSILGVHKKGHVFHACMKKHDFGTHIFI